MHAENMELQNGSTPLPSKILKSPFIYRWPLKVTFEEVIANFQSFSKSRAGTNTQNIPLDM